MHSTGGPKIIDLNVFGKTSAMQKSYSSAQKCPSVREIMKQLATRRSKCVRNNHKPSVIFAFRCMFAKKLDHCTADACANAGNNLNPLKTLPNVQDNVKLLKHGCMHKRIRWQKMHASHDFTAQPRMTQNY